MDSPGGTWQEEVCSPRALRSTDRAPPGGRGELQRGGRGWAREANVTQTAWCRSRPTTDLPTRPRHSHVRTTVTETTWPARPRQSTRQPITDMVHRPRSGRQSPVPTHGVNAYLPWAWRTPRGAGEGGSWVLLSEPARAGDSPATYTHGGSSLSWGTHQHSPPVLHCSGEMSFLSPLSET